MVDISQYPRRQTLDLRSSMASALVRMLQGAVFPGPLGQGTIQLAVAYGEWPSASDEYVGPAAAVLPGEGRDVDGQFTPSLLEDTWWPQGQPGWGLYKLSDYEASFEVKVRADTTAERAALVAGIEQMFVQDADQMLIAPTRGNRYGLLVDLPEYFGSQARFGLQSTSVLDDEESAMQEKREAVFTIAAQGKKLRVGLVQPFTFKLVLDPDLAQYAPPTYQLDG